MALVVPNATDTTGGNRFASLEQAEPDSLDVEIAGQSGRSGVVTGLQVTSNSSASTVNVSAGVISLDGVAYTVAAAPTYALPAAPADSRFDLIVARVSGGAATLATISGSNSSTNPTYPKSRSVLTGGYSPSLHVDLNSDVVIAAIFRSGGSTITTSRIADKRVLQHSGIPLQGTAVPTTEGFGTGNLYFKNDTTVDDGTASGVYVRLATGDWVGVARDIGYHLPIGAMVWWPTAATVPTNFIEPLGNALSVDTYPVLFALYGYEHGGSGSTFNLPNFANFFLRATNNGTLVGDQVADSSDTTTLTTANLAPHTHGNSHGHNYTHSHGIAHSHTASTFVSIGSDTHTHTYSRPSSNNGASATGGYSFYNNVTSSQTGGSSHSHSASASTSVSASYDNTSSQSNSTTGAASPSTTDSTGSGTSFSRIPAAKHSRLIIRVA